MEEKEREQHALDMNEQPRVRRVKGSISRSYEEIKDVAVSNVTDMMAQLSAFNTAIEKNNTADMYRLFYQELTSELKRGVNKQHEIDNLFAKKIHEAFCKQFPFMLLTERTSATTIYYKIGRYYKDRPTIGIDIATPEIYILKGIEEEWEEVQEGVKEEKLSALKKKMNELDAKVITGKEEIQQIDDKIKKLSQEKAALEQEKTLLNRKKIEQEVEEFDARLNELKDKRAEWVPYVEDKNYVAEQKELLNIHYKQIQLNIAIASKEFRLINEYFTSTKEMKQQFADFIAGYTASEGE